MAKRFFQPVNSSTIPTTATYGRVYFLDVFDEVVYGGDSRPCNYFYSVKSSSSTTRWIYATPDGTNFTPRFQIGYYKNPTWLGHNGQRIIGVDDNSPLLSYLYSTDEFPATTINGKYRFNDAITNLLNFTSQPDIIDGTSNASFPINFYCNGVDYIGISFRYSASKLTPLSVIMYRADDTYKEYTLQQFSSIFGNQMIDFGVTPQEVPIVFVDWFSSQSSVIYPYSYTVKSFTGDTVLASITDSPSMVQATLTVVGNQKILKLTGSNGDDYTLTWLSYTPEGKQLIGLSINAESNRVILPSNTSIEVSWEGDLVLYEAYGTYRPPDTTINIELYQNSSEPNRVDKTNYLEQIGTLLGAFRDETSITNMAITIQQTDFPQFNYVYIPIFGRYYYVTDITSFRENLWEISLSIDVLMTYKDAIKFCYAFVDRNEFEFSDNIIDNKRVIEQGYDVEQYTITNDLFDKSLQAPSFVLNGFALKSYSKG